MRKAFVLSGWYRPVNAPNSSLSAVLVDTGEKLLLAKDPDPNASGCQLDIDRLQYAGARIADALESGADLLIINRFGKRERDGKGLTYLIERARKADIPVVIAVSGPVMRTGSSSRAAGARNSPAIALHSIGGGVRFPRELTERPTAAICLRRDRGPTLCCGYRRAVASSAAMIAPRAMSLCWPNP